MESIFIVLYIIQVMQEHILFVKIHTLNYPEYKVHLLSLSPLHSDLIPLLRGNCY